MKKETAELLVEIIGWIIVCLGIFLLMMLPDSKEEIVLAFMTFLVIFIGTAVVTAINITK